MTGPVGVALDLAENHGLSVFPCWELDHTTNARGEPTGRKAPRTEHGFKDATRDVETIRAWWRQWPDALIGVATGRASDLYVIDVDPDGLPFYESRADDFKAQRRHKTERGWHLLYRNAGLPNTGSTLIRGVDTRGEGGYCIWWPATGLAATGELDDRGELPLWVRDRLARASTKDRTAAPAVASPPSQPGTDRSRDLLRLVAADVAKGLTDQQILEARRHHEHAQDQSDPDRAVRRCIERAREDDQKKTSHLETCVAEMRADLEAGPDAIDAAQPPAEIVEKLFFACGSNLAASGGTGKSTLKLIEAVHIVGGGRLYGREIVKQRPCVFVVAEDGADHGRYLLRRILDDGVALGAITPRHADMAKRGIHFIGWPRERFGPIAIVERDGSASPAPIFGALAELLAPLDPSCVTLDPLALLAPTEDAGNTADAVVASMLHTLGQRLGAHVEAVDHVAKHIARGGIVDQYSARGSSAKTDNARTARVLTRVTPGEIPPGMPPALTPEIVAAGDALRLDTVKLNYARRPPPVWLHRRGFWIDALPCASAEDVANARAVEDRRRRDADVAAVVAAIRTARARGEYPTGRTLEDGGVLSTDGERLPRSRLRTAISAAISTGHARLQPLPAELRAGQRREYLEAPTP